MAQVMNPNPTAVKIHKGENFRLLMSTSVCVVNAPVTNAGVRLQENLGNVINIIVCDAEDIALGERGELRELLHRFSDVISVSDTDIGRTDMAQRSIDTQNSKPIKQGLKNSSAVLCRGVTPSFWNANASMDSEGSTHKMLCFNRASL